MNDPMTADERAARLAEIREAWERGPSSAHVHRSFPDLLAEIDRLTAERDAAREIVGRLPTTADGVPVCMGDIVWHHEHGDLQVSYGLLPRTGGCDGWRGTERTDLDEDRPSVTVPLWKCYSTKEAALAATGTGGG